MARLGIDTSSNNGPVDYAALKAAGVEWVARKATEGRTYTDPGFEADSTAAKHAGMEVGLYHFARPDNGNSPEAEAANFLNACHTAPHDFRVLDIERGGGVDLSDWANRFMAAADTDWLYTYLGFLTNLPNANHRFLWVAAYQSAQPPIGDIWQFTSSGQLPGHDGRLDLNHVYYGRAAAVLAAPVGPFPYQEYPNVNVRSHTIAMTLGADGKGWGLTSDVLVSPTFVVKEQGRFAAPDDPHTYDIDVTNWRSFVRDGFVEVVVDEGRPGATVGFEVIELVPT